VLAPAPGLDVERVRLGRHSRSVARCRSSPGSGAAVPRARPFRALTKSESDATRLPGARWHPARARRYGLAQRLCAFRRTSTMPHGSARQGEGARPCDSPGRQGEPFTLRRTHPEDREASPIVNSTAVTLNRPGIRPPEMACRGTALRGRDKGRQTGEGLERRSLPAELATEPPRTSFRRRLSAHDERGAPVAAARTVPTDHRTRADLAAAVGSAADDRAGRRAPRERRGCHRPQREPCRRVNGRGMPSWSPSEVPRRQHEAHDRASGPLRSRHRRGAHRPATRRMERDGTGPPTRGGCKDGRRHRDSGA
jgi:hypothetical protein